MAAEVMLGTPGTNAHGRLLANRQRTATWVSLLGETAQAFQSYLDEHTIARCATLSHRSWRSR